MYIFIRFPGLCWIPEIRNGLRSPPSNYTVYTDTAVTTTCNPNYSLRINVARATTCKNITTHFDCYGKLYVVTY